MEGPEGQLERSWSLNLAPDSVVLHALGYEHAESQFTAPDDYI